MANLKGEKVTVKQILGVLAMGLTMFVLSNFNNNASADTFSTESQAEITQIEGNGYCKPVYYAANGYSCRYKNGKWDYIVTKGNLEATLGVMSNGWVSSLGGGYFTS